jgi:5-methyltetrahydrofolate--homocysteine methyltransferase
MVNFAAEMERQGLNIPLLIGGATTSRAHTAVKVAPRRSGPVIWVKDASRSVPVVTALLSDERRPALLAATEEDYAALRERHAAKHDRPLLTLTKARENRTPIEWTGYQPPSPKQPGITVFSDYDIAELREYIDWQPFFNAWEMKGKFPDILNNPAIGEAARKLYDDAQDMLDRLIKEKWLTANGVIGLFPANAVGDDIEVYTDERRTDVRVTLRNLRQQGEHREGIPNRSLGDFMAPKEIGIPDFVGAFAVTAGLGSQDKITEFKAKIDDYSAILLESLADRLAEAFAERMHERVRKEFWGRRRGARQRRAHRRAVRRHQAGARLPGMPGTHGEAGPLAAPQCAGGDRHRADRLNGNVARCRGERLVLLPPPAAVLRGRPSRPGPGRRLREPQGLDAQGGRALALLEPRLQLRGLSRPAAV